MEKTQDEQILEVIQAMPGVTNKEAVELTGIAYGNVTARISVMRKRGLVKTLENRHYLGDGKPLAPPKLKMKKETKVSLRITELEEEIAQLKAWQQSAIAKYPDLGVDPKILAARALAIEYYRRLNDTHKIADIKAGKLDETPLIQVALMAME